jgi:hypothetical protein
MDDNGALVAAHDALIPRGTKLSAECAVHIHRDWVPNNSHHVWPLGMGGPDAPSNRVTVCMNGHGEIHAYIDLLIQYGDEVPWPVAMHFGPRVREIARKGWVAAGRPRRGRGGD